MRRREFIAALGGAAAWPVVARGQQKVGFTVGWLAIISPATAVYLPDFRQGLSDLGYVEGQILTIEYRWAEGHVEKLPALAADLVAKKVNVIASGSGLLTALAAKAATSSIPPPRSLSRKTPSRAGWSMPSIVRVAMSQASQLAPSN
jgi:putative ABC transport system substrate-binding protein